MEPLKKLYMFNNMTNDKNGDKNNSAVIDMAETDKKEFEEFKKWKQSQKGNA